MDKRMGALFALLQSELDKVLSRLPDRSSEIRAEREEVMQMMNRLLGWAVLCLVMVACVSHAEEAKEVVTPAVTTSGGLKAILLSIFHMVFGVDQVWEGMLYVGGLLIGWLMALTGYTSWKDAAKRDAMVALTAGVITVYNNRVRKLKEVTSAGSPDGHKITSDEAKSLRDEAIAEAMELATGKGLSLLKSLAEPILHAAVEQIVGKLKGKPADSKDSTSTTTVNVVPVPAAPLGL